jgi:glucoamylase
MKILLLFNLALSLYWVSKQYDFSIKSILKNISPPGTAAGTLIASPSKSNPDYFYMWIRDAGLVMRSLVDEDLDLVKLFEDYALISTLQQDGVDLGEPKFYVDGRVFKEPWGRPQNDGPALRVLAFHSFCEKFGYNKEWYVPKLPAKSLLKADLEYVAKNWPVKNYDLWEEVLGDHFYTRMVQYSALVAGTLIAERFDDMGAAEYYKPQGNILGKSLEQFWDSKRKFVKGSINVQDDHGKTSNLDISVILACLHTGPYTINSFKCSSDRVMMTAARLVVSFKLEYAINWGREYPLIGRYPEDIYDGTGKSRGNPWILTTHAFAEYLYKIALDFAKREDLEISRDSIQFFSIVIPHANIRPGKLSPSQKFDLVGNITVAGDGFIEAVREFTKGGNYTEQIHRDSGEMKGARDLTWSYSSFITATRAKIDLINFVKNHNFLFFSV